MYFISKEEARPFWTHKKQLWKAILFLEIPLGWLRPFIILWKHLLVWENCQHKVMPMHRKKKPRRIYNQMFISHIITLSYIISSLTHNIPVTLMSFLFPRRLLPWLFSWVFQSPPQILLISHFRKTLLFFWSNVLLLPKIPPYLSSHIFYHL